MDANAGDGGDDGRCVGVRCTASVIIPVRNGATTIGPQLDALGRQSMAALEIIVADNGSTDGTAEVVRARAGVMTARVVQAAGRAGASHARNVGASAAIGEVLAFCDADDIADHDWLRSLVRLTAPGRIVGGKLSVAGLNETDDVDSISAPISAGSRRAGEPIAFAPTSNMAIMRSDFEALGGFREDYRAGEDVEFCDRARGAGFSVLAAPEAIVEYRYRNTGWGTMRQRFVRGLASAQVHRDHPAVHPARPLGVVVRSWLWLFLRAPTLLQRPGRTRWLAVAGRNAGRLAGSIRHRTMAL